VVMKRKKKLLPKFRKKLVLVQHALLIWDCYPAMESIVPQLRQVTNSKFNTFLIKTDKSSGTLEYEKIWGVQSGTAYLLYDWEHGGHYETPKEGQENAETAQRTDTPDMGMERGKRTRDSKRTVPVNRTGTRRKKTASAKGNAGDSMGQTNERTGRAKRTQKHDTKN
jgi:hypothetical protein